MSEMKNICGKIPIELHERVRQEIELTESNTQKFILQVIEEHFSKGEMRMSMEMRTVAVQVSEELFSRLKAVITKKGCKQKEFLLTIIEQAIEAEEAKFRQESKSRLQCRKIPEEAEEGPVEPDTEESQPEQEATAQEEIAPEEQPEDEESVEKAEAGWQE